MSNFLISFFKRIFGLRFSKPIGYMAETIPNDETGDWETITYSPYFEYEFTTDDGALLAPCVRLVVTLKKTQSIKIRERLRVKNGPLFK